jgi:molybdopterin molybdotransferase
VRFADLKADGETALRIIGTSFAGKPFEGTTGPGQAVRIMTGAVIPFGADTVIQQERAKASGEQVAVLPVPKIGTNTRSAGEDLRAGEAALKRGQPVRPAEIGMMASLGIGEVAVYRRLRVAFFSTGDELVAVGSPLGPGQILTAIATPSTACWCGWVAGVDMGVIRDTPRTSNAFRKRRGPPMW